MEKRNKDTSDKRNVSFFYIGLNDSDEYRETINKYLEEKEKEFNDVGGLGVIVMAHNFDNFNNNQNLSGHLYVQEIEKNPEEFEEVCDYVLSKERKFIPKAVKCNINEDYSMIEDILKKNYGENAGLKNNFWEFGKSIKTK
mgnify:CR=1 FL=1